MVNEDSYRGVTNVDLKFCKKMKNQNHFMCIAFKKAITVDLANDIDS